MAFAVYSAPFIYNRPPNVTNSALLQMSCRNKLGNKFYNQAFSIKIATVYHQ